jgi:lipopolysaccharide transport system ATP-binding protein
LGKAKELNAGVFEPDTLEPSIANGVARLTAVNLWVDGALQDKGVKPILQSLQSDFEVEVVFTASLTLKCPSVALVVTDHTGRNITSCSNFYDQVSLDRDELGVVKARVVFPKFQLLRGQYALNVFLMCERAIHIYDHAQVCEFEVEQEGREIGLVSLNRNWVE